MFVWVFFGVKEIVVVFDWIFWLVGMFVDKLFVYCLEVCVGLFGNWKGIFNLGIFGVIMLLLVFGDFEKKDFFNVNIKYKNSLNLIV